MQGISLKYAIASNGIKSPRKTHVISQTNAKKLSSEIFTKAAQHAPFFSGMMDQWHFFSVVTLNFARKESAIQMVVQLTIY